MRENLSEIVLVDVLVTDISAAIGVVSWEDNLGIDLL